MVNDPSLLASMARKFIADWLEFYCKKIRLGYLLRARRDGYKKTCAVEKLLE